MPVATAYSYRTSQKDEYTCAEPYGASECILPAQTAVLHLQKYAAEAWEALRGAPSPEELQQGPRVRTATKLKPFR